MWFHFRFWFLFSVFDVRFVFSVFCVSVFGHLLWAMARPWTRFRLQLSSMPEPLHVKGNALGQLFVAFSLGCGGKLSLQIEAGNRFESESDWQLKRCRIWLQLERRKDTAQMPATTITNNNNNKQ